MKLQVIQATCGGRPQDPFVTEDQAKAQVEFERLTTKYELDPGDPPHSDDTDLYWWAVETA